MTARREWFVNYTPFGIPISIGLGDNSIIKAIGLGSIRISMDVNSRSKIFELCDMYYVLDMGTNNLLSISYIVKKGYTVNFGVDKCEIAKDRIIVGEAYSMKGLWVLKGNTSLITQNSANIAKMSLSIWHRQLGHSIIRSVKKLLDLSMVTGMKLLDIGDVNETHCIPYLKGKTTYEVIPKKSNVENPRRLHRIFSDICGPLNVEGYSRCCYFMTFVDGYSYFMKVKPIRTKDKASEVLTDWIMRSEIETGEKVNFLRTDGGGEYMESIFQNWLRTKGIYHKRTNPGTPQENGMAEQLNRTILEMTQSMLFDTELP